MENNELLATETTEVATTPVVEKSGKPSKPEFSEEQQRFIDKLINKKYAEAQEVAEKKLKDIEQAERLKNMSEAERINEELRLAREKLEAYEKEKLVSQFKVELSTKGIKADFAELIPVNDADKAKKAVDFLGLYKQEIETPLQEKIKTLEEQLRNSALRGTVPTTSVKNVDITKKANTGLI